MRNIRTVFRLLGFGICLGCFFLTSLIFLPWLKQNTPKVRGILMRLAVFYAATFSKIMGIEGTLKGEVDELLRPGAKLVVSNHMSYLDILLFAPHLKSSFVTSREVQQWPLIGQVVTAAGCLFVDRKNRHNLGHEISELAEALKSGISVSVFPEATSTNGDRVLRFRRPLFNAALVAQVPIIPVTINYTQVDGDKVNHGNRDLVCWYDDMGFISHFLNLTRFKGVRAELIVGQSLLPAGDAQSLAEKAQAIVSENFHSLSSFEQNSIKESVCHNFNLNCTTDQAAS